VTSKVVVTGGSGRLGQCVIAHLLEHGREVLSLDRVAPSARPCPSWITDLRRPGDVYQAVRGADGVVHLAAWQAPNLASDSETFTTNISATYNVLKAATDTGVVRVVVASSVAAYGYLYAARLEAPEYLPIDERHPSRPQDPYGLSKVVGEQVADSFARAGTTSIVSLRFPGLNFDPTFSTFPDRWREPERRARGFWSYIDARDAATACYLALTTAVMGHEVFNVAAPGSAMREPTLDLIRQYLPHMPEIRGRFEGNWSGVDSSKAQRILGFRTEHTWERYLPEAAL
jgi:nucleoside-diphosphate-sugar epimerase